MGFPIKKDKTFLFVSFEGLRAERAERSSSPNEYEYFSSDTGAETQIIGGLTEGIWCLA